ncbi:MAG: hypothetical protein PF693_13380 [Spirochaetia bacterium]|jgi:hypothetical protein|nr:hypothetical protein [Spirochaetia bacterium]
MSFTERLRGIGGMVLAVLAGAVGFFLLTLGVKGKQGFDVKEVEIDSKRIRDDSKKRIMDMSSDDFATEFPGVGDAAERGKRRFADRVKGLLHRRGSDGNSTGNTEDSRGRN